MSTTEQPPGGGAWRVRRLTADEAKARFADVMQRFAQLERRWEAHRDRQALLGMLIFSRPLIPESLFTGLLESLSTPRRTLHFTRWSMVKGELDGDPTLRVRQACENVSRKLAKATSRGAPSTIERSYFIVENLQRQKPRAAPGPRAARALASRPT